MDYRPLNSKTVDDSYPLPRIQGNLDQLQGNSTFSTLDAAGAYHVIPVTKEAKDEDTANVGDSGRTSNAVPGDLSKNKPRRDAAVRAQQKWLGQFLIRN